MFRFRGFRILGFGVQIVLKASQRLRKGGDLGL